MIESFLVLLLAHLCGDFLLQSRSQVEGKTAGRVSAFLAHGTIHWLLATLLSLVFLPPSWRTQAILCLSIAGHLAVDGVKEWVKSRRPAARASTFLGDQLGHLLLIVLSAAAIAGIDLGDLLRTGSDWLLAHRLPLLAGGSVYVGVIFGGGYLIQLLLEPFRPRPDAPSPDEGAPPGRDMPNAGMYIGWMERAVVLTAIASGELTLVGLVIAAKAIIRFKETDKAFAEYFLLGTFLSLLLAGAGALALRMLLGG